MLQFPVLLQVYVQCIAGRDDIAQRRIEQAFADADKAASDDQPQPDDDPPPGKGAA